MFSGRYNNYWGKIPLRQELRRLFRERGMIPSKGGHDGYICALPMPPKGNRVDGNWCGLKKSKLRMYDQLVNSNFCLEPPGDTPTRSHFYLAVLSGCIPVIFDHGVSGMDAGESSASKGEVTEVWGTLAYDGLVRTSWAWRDSPGTKLDYNDFTVVVNANNGVLSGGRDIMTELINMPERDPERFAALRRGLEKAAPRMRFASSDCGEPSCDGFRALQDAIAAHMLRNK